MSKLRLKLIFTYLECSKKSLDQLVFLNWAKSASVQNGADFLKISYRQRLLVVLVPDTNYN